MTVTDEELRSLDPEASRSIEIVEFVDLEQVDPLAYDNAYYLEPDELATKAYKVLLMALDQAGKVAVARIVMRQKEYVAVIRPTENALVLSTLVYADEVESGLRASRVSTRWVRSTSPRPRSPWPNNSSARLKLIMNLRSTPTVTESECSS